MSNKLKIARMYILRGLDYLLWAGMFGLITYWYWFALADVLSVYVWNIIGISAALIMDRIRLRRIYKKVDAPADEKTRAKLAKKDVGSLKTSLYLFYVIALIVSQVITMNPTIGVSENMRGYLKSVEMGIIALFAIDNFFGYLVSDNERMKKFKEKFKSDQE